MAVSLRRRPIGSIAAVFAVLTVVVLVPPRAQAVSPNIVISQVYGGGGNSGATYTHDFIELFNRGTAAASVDGWSVQYGAAAGDVGAATNSTTRTDLPSVTLAPGQYLLIQEAPGAGGTTPLPTPDVTDASPIAMSATAGKVALVNTTTPLACGSSTTPCSTAQLATIVDLVGYGSTANLFEGSGPTPAPSNTTAVLRAGAGCTDTDTDNNNADFVVGAPNPRNTASPLNPCGDSNAPVVATCGGAITTAEGYAATRTVTGSDADGVVTNMQITSVTPSPAPGSITLGSFVPSSGIGGTASAVVTVDNAVPPGTYAVVVTATNSNATPQTGSCTLNVIVADDRGIVAAFLFRTDRVELLPATAGHPVLGSSPTVEYRGDALAYNTDVQNPKALNADLPSDVDLSTGNDGTNVFTRAPQVGLFRIWQDGIGEETPTTCTRSATTSAARRTPGWVSEPSRPVRRGDRRSAAG